MVLRSGDSLQRTAFMRSWYCLYALQIDVMLSVRYPHQLDMTYPPPPTGRAPCRNLKTTRTLTPRCVLVVACGFVMFCFLYLLILTVVASAYSSRSTRNASAASLDGLAPANVAMQRARWRTKLRAVGG